jgi:hypothetical protein
VADAFPLAAVVQSLQRRAIGLEGLGADEAGDGMRRAFAGVMAGISKEMGLARR